MTDLDSRIREAETSVWEHYGLDPRSHTLRLAGTGTAVRVLEFGDDGASPPVLFLHGIASVTAVAAPLIAEVARTRRVITLDWPGHGLSDAVAVRRGTVRTHAVTVLDDLFAALGIAQADVVAHSLGGQFALYFSLDRPDRVRRLVLLGAPGAGMEGVHPATAMKLMATPVIGGLMLRMPASEKAYLRNSDALLGAGALDGYPPAIATVGHLSSQRPGFATSLSALFQALLTPGQVRDGIAVSPAELATLTQPVLLVWGDRDVFMTPDAARASIEAIPDHRLLLVPGAGHAPWLDDAVLVAAEVTSTLDA
jgi:pimeloyl-ACP methyl ester carboxylesterase